MRGRAFFAGLLLAFGLELALLALFSAHGIQRPQDTVAVNEIVQTVRRDWNDLEAHVNVSGFDYVVLGADGAVLYRTRPGLSESVNAGIAHRDTMLDVEAGGTPAGKLIIYNDDALTRQLEKRAVAAAAAAAMLLQLGICAGYFYYLRRTMVIPFRKLERFAQRVAGGNLDIPLEMDRHNLFGAFTESFDLMRAELKKARIAEAKANAAKKELVAKLSHDIKTPVASIKAASEVGAALAADDKTRENYRQIIQKADQINTLVTNLFSATLEELQELTVTPSDMKSGELPRLKEKFMRGGNAQGIEGAGLGLYISDHCMREMGGRLTVENGTTGLRAVVQIALSRGI